jgi:methionine-rich copper-binding protein CopC
MKSTLIAAGAAAAILVPSAAASQALTAPPTASAAHAEIKSLRPKPGAVKPTSLRAVTATFEEAIVSGALTVRHGPTKVSVGKAKLIKGKTGLRARLRSSLAKGTYKASMKWLADDGHLERKTWKFTLR